MGCRTFRILFTLLFIGVFAVSAFGQDDHGGGYNGGPPPDDGGGYQPPPDDGGGYQPPPDDGHHDDDGWDDHPPDDGGGDPPPQQGYCGDGNCDGGIGEDQQSCSADCGQPSYCGDYYCEGTAGEDQHTCPTDCGTPAQCGDYYCEGTAGEDQYSCPQDCGQPPQEYYCGDGMCHGENGETQDTCPNDCGEPFQNAYCGDGNCDTNEDSSSCSVDCGEYIPEEQNYCGDGTCDSNEDQYNCAPDCGDPTPEETCGNGVCESFEDKYSCTPDCGEPEDDHGYCGDGHCDPNESPQYCPQDCEGPSDGCMPCNFNGICEGHEPGCCEDCDHPHEGRCGDNICDENEVGWCHEDCGDIAPPGDKCGDGWCEPNVEHQGNCPADCGTPGGECNHNGMCEGWMGEGPGCPDCEDRPRMCNDDGHCEPGEPGHCPDCQQMQQDCNYNGRCEEGMGEGPWCPDCGGMTGCFDNGMCDPGEPQFCKDCSAMFCGDGHCGPGEDPYNCFDDCMVGEKACNFNGMCDYDEGPWCEDCMKMRFCGDGMCEGMEDPFNCPQDCGAMGWCGDSVCEENAGENEFSCPQDCKESTRCGDGICGRNEDSRYCPMDCIDAFCGNGMCEPGEMESCPTDCKLERYCGDGFCDDYEKEFCFADCEVEAECGDGICDFGEWDSCYSDCEVEEYCGDGYCSDEEDFMMCPIDCEPEGFCGDMFCDPGEEEWCPEDCGIEGFCGDGFCGFNENPGNCHDDCTFMEYFMEMETDKFFYQPGDTVEIIARIKDHEGNQPDHAMVRANVFFMGEFQIKETRIIKVDRTYEEEAATTTATSAADLVSESNPQPAPAPSSSAVVATTATTAADTEYATAIGQAVAAAGGGYGGGAGTGGGYGMDKKGPGDVMGIGGPMGPGGFGPGIVTEKDMMGGGGHPSAMGPGMGGPMGPGMGKDMMMGGPMMGPGGPMMLPPELQAQIGTSIQTRDGRTIKIQLEPGNERDPCPDNVCDGWELGAGDCPDDCKEVPGWSQSRGFGTGKEMMGPPGQGGFRGFENAGPGMGGPMGPDMMMRQGAHEMIRHEERGPRPEDSEDWKGDLYEKFPIQLDWNAEKQAYVGDFELEAGAKNGQYEIEVFALIDDRKMHHMMPFTVSEEGADAKDPFAFEQKGKSAAMKGEYQACVNDYIEAATLWVDQHHAQRVIVDVEKASTCIVLGDLDREEPYVKISEIVEDMAKKRGGPEKYIMMGTAAQYAELAGRHKEAKSMYRRAIKGLEREAEFVADFDPQGGVMLRLILGKYYEMVGQDDAAVKTYVEVAESIGDAFGQYGGPPEFIQALISAKLYEVAGEFEDAKFAYEEAADLIEFEEDVPGDAFGAVTTFMQGYCLEKAGNKEEAMDRYADAAELLDDIDMIDSEGIFFGSSAVGKSLERLGSPEEANDIFMSALKNLERRADQEGYYFASGISGYTGDFEKAKLYCKKELLRNLDADDIERMTFYSAYCYDVLGAGRKARAACNLAQTMPEAGESIMMRFVFEPFPTPASFCSKAMAVQPIERLETCGNDVLDPGETEDTCCSDVGCGSGYVCSNTLEKCVLPAKEIEPEKILKLILELEDIRMTFDGLASKALGISDFFAEKGNDERAGIWSGVADEFLGAGDKIDDIQRKIKDNRNALTEEILEDVRSDIRDLRDVINKAIDLILEAV